MKNFLFIVAVLLSACQMISMRANPPSDPAVTAVYATWGQSSTSDKSQEKSMFPHHKVFTSKDDVDKYVAQCAAACTNWRTRPATTDDVLNTNNWSFDSQPTYCSVRAGRNQSDPLVASANDCDKALEAALIFKAHKWKIFMYPNVNGYAVFPDPDDSLRSIYTGVVTDGNGKKVEPIARGQDQFSATRAAVKVAAEEDRLHVKW